MERDDKPLVSVIVTVYNREKWIEKCVNHLLVEQTFQDFEILLVDNGSTDHSVAVMKECQKKHPERIRIILASDRVGGGVKICRQIPGREEWKMPRGSILPFVTVMTGF